MSRLFAWCGDYFFSSGLDSLTELAMQAWSVPSARCSQLELVVPVPVVLVVESALGASAGAGVGVGAATGAVGAGAGGGVTTFSSFLQAMRPTARMAARRSERFIFFPLEYVTRFNQMNNRWMPALQAYPIVIPFYQLPARAAYCSGPGGHNPVTLPAATGAKPPTTRQNARAAAVAPSSSFRPRATRVRRNGSDADSGSHRRP